MGWWNVSWFIAAMILINALDRRCQCESIVRDDDDDVDSSDSNASSSSVDKPRSKDPKMFNFASQAAGAVVLDKSPAAAKGFHNLLNDDRDKYGICACDEKKWVVIGLSEDILVASVEVANYEKYSSMLKDFQILASNTYPTSEWIDLGTYTAEAHLGPQLFAISRHTDAHTRYLKFKFLTHYLNEALCTLSQIKVFGMTVIASFKQEVERSDNQMRDMLSSLNRELELGGDAAADDESTVPLNVPSDVLLDEGAGAGTSPTSVELTADTASDDAAAVGPPPPVIAQPIPYVSSADSDTDASSHGSTSIVGIADQTILSEGGGTPLDPSIGPVAPDQVIDGLGQGDPAESHTHTHDAGIAGSGDHTQAAELLGGEEESTNQSYPTGPTEACELEQAASGEPRTTPPSASTGESIDGAADPDVCSCCQEKSYEDDDLRIVPTSSQSGDVNGTAPESDPALALEVGGCYSKGAIEGAIDDRTVVSSADDTSSGEAVTGVIVHAEVVVSAPMDAVPVEGSTAATAAVNTDGSPEATMDTDQSGDVTTEPMAVAVTADLVAAGVESKSGVGFEFAQKMKSLLLPPIPFYELSGIFSSSTPSSTPTPTAAAEEEERNNAASEATAGPTEVLCSNDSASIQLSIEPSTAATTPLIPHDGHRIGIQRLGALESQGASSLNLIKVFVEKDNISIIPTAVSSLAVAVSSLEVVVSEVQGSSRNSSVAVAVSSPAANVSTPNSSNHSSSATTYGLNCMEHLSFAEFQKKMLSKLQQKSNSTGHGLDVSQDSSSSSSRDSNVFRSLMQKIKGLEMNQAIVEMYIIQVSSCLCSETL